MNNVKTFVCRVYKRKKLEWIINSFFLSLSLFLTVYLFWVLFNQFIYMNPFEWKIMPFTLLFTFLPFFFGKPSLSVTVDFLESRIKELKGRLYLVMDPFHTSLDSNKYREKAIMEISSILKEKKPKELFPFRINSKYLIPLPILILFFFRVGFRLNKVSPEPAIFYIQTPTQKKCPTLLLAKCPSIRRLYLFSSEEVKKMVHLGDGKFGIMTKPEHSMEIRVGYRGWRSQKKNLVVVPGITIEELTLEYQFPAYLGVEPLHDIILNPDKKIPIQVLSGTEVMFSGRSNVELGNLIGNITKEKIEKNEFGGSFRVREPGELKVKLIDTLSFSSFLLQFMINMIRDDPPSIEIISPIGDYKLDESMEVPITLQAKDDYGLSAIKLNSKEMEKDLGNPMGARFIEDSITLRISDLMPGETLKVKASAIDLAGNRSFTPPLSIFMPGLREMFSNSREFTDTLGNYASELQQREKMITEKIQKFLHEPEISPLLRSRIEKTLEEQKNLLENVGRMARLAKKIQNPQITKELERINELLDKIGTREILEKLEDIEKNQNYSIKKLEELNLSQEKILDALKLARKSLESLKSLMELNEFLKLAEDLYKKQDEITSTLPNDSLASLEEGLSEELRKMIQEMKESFDKELKKIAEEFEIIETNEKMSNLASWMKKGEMNEKLAGEIKDSLKRLYQNLKNAREERTGEKTRKAIREKGWELGFILKNHNNLIEKEPGLEIGLIEKGLSEGVDKINRELKSLFLMSFAFSPEVLGNLSEAKERMEDLSRELLTSKPPLSSMERINLLLIQSIIKLFSSPPSSGLSLMNMMEQIIREQQSITNNLQQILPLPIGEREEEMKNLSEKQRGLARKLREVGGALGPLARDMEEMAKKMERGELDIKLLERQKKTLDRLLEAKKSIRRMGVSKKRRSEPGIFVSAPKISLPENFGEEKKELREILKKRMKESYPLTYKKEIERYIRKLLE